jgi:hypothetical protein
MRHRQLLAVACALMAELFSRAAPAVDFKRAENVGGLHLRIPIEYLAGGHDDSEFLLAVRWPSMQPLGDSAPAGARDVLYIGGDEDQLAMALPLRFETMRRYVGAGASAGKRYGLQLYPRDPAASRGHFDPHLELMAHFEVGEVRSLITCAPAHGLLPPLCRDELVLRGAHITLDFPKPLLAEWRAM